MKKTRRKKRRLSRFTWLIIILITCFFAYNLLNKKEVILIISDEVYTTLSDKGYTDSEITDIKKLKSTEIELILDLDYKDYILDLFNGTYFIDSNVNRYITYYDLHRTLSIDEAITKVNTNRDFSYYTNVQNTDLSKNTLLLTNKYYRLDATYEPADLIIMSGYGVGKLRAIAYAAYVDMYNDSKAENLKLYAASTYRSYNTQNTLYNNYVAKDGQVAADTYSARPGYSEHQTGLAVDIAKTGGSIDNFESTSEFTWVKNNAHLYGFILRYPSDGQDTTGYVYEPWHYRYVGIEVATYIYEHNITFDEYYAYFVK